MNYNIPISYENYSNINNINTTNDNIINTYNPQNTEINKIVSKPINKNLSLTEKLRIFLVQTKPNTALIFFMFGVALGNSFKDFIYSFSENIFQPIILLVLSKTKIQKFHHLLKFLTSMLSFILILVMMYYMQKNFFNELVSNY